jgi:cysteine desulfurase
MDATADLVYLDHAATTPLRPEAREAMMPWLSAGNPSGVHSAARAARRAIDDARDVMAEALGCEAGEVVFTSGGTEADNLAVTGAVLGLSRGRHGPVVACSAVEHPAVLEPVLAAGGSLLPVDKTGAVDPYGLETACQGDLAAVSVMLVNNETGVVNDLEDLIAVVRSQSAALFHTDAVQAMRWLDVALLARQADLVTVSAHKFGGPKGAGALVVRGSARSRLRPVLRGGPQEQELRAGTQAVAPIVGMAEAARLAVAERSEVTARVEGLAHRLQEAIRVAVPTAAALPTGDKRVGGILNMGFPGVESEEMLIALDRLGVCASAGSACASGALEPSHVLLAMGLGRDSARTHVRFSLGAETTIGDVEAAAAAVGRAFRDLSDTPV